MARYRLIDAGGRLFQYFAEGRRVLCFRSHGQSFSRRRWWVSGRPRPVSVGFCHGLRGGLPYYSSGERGGFLLEFLGRQQFWHHALAHVVRDWNSILE